MVRILHRYIFRELLLVFTVSTVGLTGLLGFACVLQALQRYGLAPTEALKFLLLSMPTTLFVALPMGGVLAATLVYGRLAADNEINACRASGVHLGHLIWPGVVFGLLAVILNLILYAWPIPASWYGTKIIAKRDIERIFFEQLRTHGRVGYEGYELVVDRTEGDILYGVLVSYQQSGQPRWYGVAPYAMVTFDKKENRVRFTLRSAESWQEGGRDRGHGNYVFGFDIPAEIPREPLDVGFSELAAWHDRPEISPEVARLLEEKASPERIEREKNEIRAKCLAELHGRLGFCFCSLALVVMGIALSLVFEGAHFLVPFAVGIGPAIGTVVMTDLGKKLIAQHPACPQDYVFLVWLVSCIVLVASVGLIVWQLLRR